MSYYSYDNRNGGGGLLSFLPPVTKNILVINVFMLIFSMLRPEFMYSNFALYYPTSPMFHWWQPITHMFMHGGFWHLFANMFTFIMFGATLERQWGPRKYLLFYMVTGLGAAALHMGVMWCEVLHYQHLIAEGSADAAMALRESSLIKRTPMVGASGAIYGVLMGFALLFPDTVITLLFPPIPLKAKWWILIWLGIELFTGITGAGGGIAHFAHLGGALFGWLLIRYWKRKGTMYNYYSE